MMGAEAAFFVELKDRVRHPEHAFDEIKKLIEKYHLVEFVDMEVR